jgi:hypothetical protein
MESHFTPIAMFLLCVGVLYHQLVKWSKVLNLEVGGLTNTKMSTSIYTGSDRQSVIPYVQCEWVSSLLI